MARTRAVVMNEQPTIQSRLITYIVGFAVIFYLMTLFGAAWTPDCGFSKWVNTFVIFIIEQGHFLVGFTRATPAFICVGECIWTLGYLYYITAIQHPFRGREHGDAHWGDVHAFSKAYANHDKRNEVVVNFGSQAKPKQPVIVNTHNYWLAEGVYVNIDNKLTSNLNILVVGPPGTGKSFRLARPILSQLCGNFLVTDPKGELSKQTGQFFKDNGYEFLVLNIESEESMEHSIHFNPFRYLRNESDILSLTQILFKATKDPDADNGGDAFFEQSAETLCTCLFYLMHYTYSPEEKDWEHFVDLLESTVVKANEQTGGIDNSDPNGILNRFERANEGWLKGIYTLDKNGRPQPQKDNLKGLVDIRKFYSGAQETTSSIVASLDAHCRYMKLQCVKKLLSEDEIDIKNSFGYCKKTKNSPTGKRVLFIVTSEDKRYYDWITSMVYSMFFDELYHLTTVDEKLHDTLPEHLTFLMDEFANITLPDSFVEKLSTMRSRGMSAVVIIQNLIQLKRKFPKFDMDKDLIGNMSIIDILGAPDQDSCEYLSKAFGTMTIHKQTTGLSRGSMPSFSENEDVMNKPLFSAEDMYGMNKDGPCAMIIKGTNPLWVLKCQFQNSPLLPLLTRKKPYRMVRNDDMGIVKKIDHTRSPCEQQPELLIGSAAEAFLKQCEDEGVKVVKLSLDDIDNMAVLDRNNRELIYNDATTKEFKKDLQRQTERYWKEKTENTLNYDNYDDEKIQVVQKLRNAGFPVIKIKALDRLIQCNIHYEELTTYFSPDMDLKEISSFADRLVDIKEKM